MAERIDGRRFNQLRPVDLQPNFTIYAEGSVLCSMGETKVLCTASIEEGAPSWLKEQEPTQGWVTAEYSMLPRATLRRTRRETSGPRGRTQEISRLIGRSLRQAVDLSLLGPRTITIDCDVLQADGGTRTASITGGCAALHLAVNKLISADKLPPEVLKSPVAAISVGIVAGTALLDLCYHEDVSADVDANFVMNGDGQLIEIQGTGEKSAFSTKQLGELITLAEQALPQLLEAQLRAING